MTPVPSQRGYNPAMSDNRLERTLARLRTATVGTKYEGKLWVVGGYVRDKLLGLSSDGDDVDIVLEESSAELAAFFEEAGLAEHSPVTYPRFGTAMVTVSDVTVELVTARRESYAAGSRKPDQVEPATIAEDAKRRDFTINTLLENLHTGDIVDPLQCGRADLATGIIRTPLAAADTFADDPLRMLRAIRFAARFSFAIDESTQNGIFEKGVLLVPTVSAERIRDEFCKILLGKDPAAGLDLLLGSGLLHYFASELTDMVGITQNEFHGFPVWEHTLVALSSLLKIYPDAPLLLRLAVTLHDCGKPSTKTIGDDGRIHFYGHQDIGAQLAKRFLNRLKFSHADTEIVVSLIAQHMRIGEYKPDEWTDAAVRRFIRAAGSLRDWLFLIHRADVAALRAEHQDISRAYQLRSRIDSLLSQEDVIAMESPLSGSEIMSVVPVSPGPAVGHIKAALTDAVLEGQIGAHDKIAAVKLAKELFEKSSRGS
jgi:poly(A) polymerase